MSDEAEEYIAFIADHATPKAISRIEIASATADDPELQDMIKCIRGETSSDQAHRLKTRNRFERVMSELCITEDGIVLRGSRIVLPESLQDRAVRTAHEGHQGRTKTTAMLRTKVWFIGMDAKVDSLIDQCPPCQLNEAVHASQPMQPTELPARNWQKLATDFWGPLPNGHELMVVQDKKTRFVVVFEVTTTASEHVLTKLEDLFSLMGIPEELTSDNGPPFNGRAFAEFAQFMGFRHRKITPEHPQANGMAEKFMVSLGKIIRNALSEGKSWRSELQAFLRSYRANPHRTTGVAPSEALFGSSLTSRLPRIELPKSGTREQELLDELQRLNDNRKKERARQYTDLKRKAVRHNFRIGEQVLLRQKRLRKSMTRYSDRDLTVIAVKTSMITVQDVEGNTLTRDASKFKRKMFAGPVDSHVDAGLGSKPNEDKNDTEPVVEALPDNPVESGQPAESRRRGRPIGSTNEARKAAREAEATATTGPNERRYPQRDKQEPERFQAGQRR